MTGYAGTLNKSECGHGPVLILKTCTGFGHILKGTTLSPTPKNHSQAGGSRTFTNTYPAAWRTKVERVIPRSAFGRLRGGPSPNYLMIVQI